MNVTNAVEIVTAKKNQLDEILAELVGKEDQFADLPEATEGKVDTMKDAVLDLAKDPFLSDV